MFFAKLLCASCALASLTAFASDSETTVDEKPAFGIKNGVFSAIETDDMTPKGCYTIYGNTLHDGNGMLHLYGDVRYPTGDSRESCGNNDYEYKLYYGSVRQQKFGGYCWNLPGTPAWYTVTYCP